MQEAGWVSAPVWTAAENLAPHWDSICGMKEVRASETSEKKIILYNTITQAQETNIHGFLRNVIIKMLLWIMVFCYHNEFWADKMEEDDDSVYM